MPEHDKYFSSDQDPYLDQETNTLKNIPNLDTPEKLEAFETSVFQAVFADASKYIASKKTINLSNWKELHKACFSDVYVWAGELRTVRIAKENTVFAYPETIESEAHKLFTQMEEDFQQGNLTLDKAAEYFTEINVLHPFREGNGRTQRILFTEILNRIGYTIDYTLTNQNEIIKAMIHGYNGDYAPIKKLFHKITQSVK